MFHATKKTGVAIKLKFLAYLLPICLAVFSCKQQPQPITITTKDPLAQKFYAVNHQSIYWFSSGKTIKKANEWLNAIDSANSSGLTSGKIQNNQIREALSNNNAIDDTLKEKTDQQLTALVLNFLKELQEGNIHFDYDEVGMPRDSVYIDQLINSKPTQKVSKLISTLDCKDPDYLVLKKYLNDSVTPADSLKYNKVVRSMNYRRYLTVNQQTEYVLVNIPTAEAEYYKDGLLALKMRTVPGKKKNKTPTIASYITSIVTFPAWNVPHSIAVKEILPKVLQDESYLEQHNFEVVDSKGNVLDDSELNWTSYTEKNFPYFFRQSTGADNSLGVVKFDFKNPFSIFLHATSWQGVFAKDFRFLSHGCVRLEKPFELADALLRGEIDIQELKTGKKDTESNMLTLPVRVPVFLIYAPAIVVDNNVIFKEDVYGLF
ncbi:MAG: L,D-transpeptidase family protein [Prolixibacteraceae bacterium]